MSALLSLYREALGIRLDNVRDVVRARVPGRLPVVLSRAEVRKVLAELQTARCTWWRYCCMERGCAWGSVFRYGLRISTLTGAS